MSSSDFAEVVLEGDQTLPRRIKDAAASLNSRIEETTNIKDAVEKNAKKPSALHEWVSLPLEQSTRPSNVDKSSARHKATFPMFEVLDQIVSFLKHADVICLIAPTGAGKSVLAPIIAEMLAASTQKDYGVETYRKSLLVAPNVEHCSSTARNFNTFFGDTGISVSAFLNPYEERPSSPDQSAPEFVFTTYNSAIRVLPSAKLNLLILDEVHAPNDNVQVTIAMALKMLLGERVGGGTTQRWLNKLMLMTATLDDKERKAYQKYFASKGLSFVLLDLSKMLDRNKQLTMSCLDGDPVPEMFEATPMSSGISNEISLNTARLSIESISEAIPNSNSIHHRMRLALIGAMEQAVEDLKKRLREGSRDCDMQSIIVILPGLLEVDKMYSAVFKLAQFKLGNEPAFHPVRLTSLVNDDRTVTTKCVQRGTWSGHLGRIVFTTNLVAAGLTVPNCAYVIDSGLQKILSEYTRDGLKGLETTWIDEMMIVQRAGRTGRTTDGEYILPYPVEKVDAMMKKDHGDLLLNRDFDERHFLYFKSIELTLLHEPPNKIMRELQKSMEIRGSYSTSKGIPNDVLLMDKLFNFLSTEFARIVIQGTAMGITAHVILLVADAISRVKFCRAGFIPIEYADKNGSSMSRSAVHLYCEAMDAIKHSTRTDIGRSHLPAKYSGVGDSIALADLLASFVFLVGDKSRSQFDRIYGPPVNFWSNKKNYGNLSQLYASFVKNEGRDALMRNKLQIESALRAAGFLPKGCDLFDERFNRHVVSRENFCLNEDGRALLSALLTMHSSRTAKLARDPEETTYQMKRETPNGVVSVSLYPESIYSLPIPGHSKSNNGDIYGRYTEMFERKRGEVKVYSGAIDPVNVKQMIYFLNINGVPTIRTDDNSILFHLNAAIGVGGMKIRVNTDKAKVYDVRKVLQTGLLKLSHTKNAEMITGLEQFIIDLWRECDGALPSYDELYRKKELASLSAHPARSAQQRDGQGVAAAAPHHGATPTPTTSAVITLPALVVFPESVAVEARGGGTTLALTNRSSIPVMFQIKSSNDALYRVRPDHGFLKASFTVTIEITRVAGPAQTDKFAIDYAPAPEGATDAEKAFERTEPIGSITCTCRAIEFK